MRAVMTAPSLFPNRGGRGSRIRTCDLKYPKLPRCQTALYPAWRRSPCPFAVHSLSCGRAADKGGNPITNHWVPSLIEQRMADAVADPQTDAGRRPGIDFEYAIGWSARGNNFFRQGLGIFGEPDHLA